MQRRPSQIFNFSNPERFIEAVRGKSQVVIYVGKVKAEDGTESWKAMYWEPTDPVSSFGVKSSDTLLPLGSLAWLAMDSQFDIVWELDKQQKEFQVYAKIHNQMVALARKIGHINRENPLADTEQFKYMSAEELKPVVEKMRQTYEAMTKNATVSLENEEKGDEEVDEEEEE